MNYLLYFPSISCCFMRSICLLKTFDCGLFLYTLRSWERYLSVLLMVQHSIVVCSSIHYGLESATYPCYWWFNIRLWFVLLYITVLRAILIRVTDGSTFDCGLFFYTLRSWERYLSVLLMVQHSIVVCSSIHYGLESDTYPCYWWFNIRLWFVLLYITVLRAILIRVTDGSTFDCGLFFYTLRSWERYLSVLLMVQHSIVVCSSIHYGLESATYPCYWWFNIRLWFVLLYITVLRAILIRVTDGSTFDCGLFFYTLRSWERNLSVLLMVQHSIVVCSSIHYGLESDTYFMFVNLLN